MSRLQRFRPWRMVLSIVVLAAAVVVAGRAMAAQDRPLTDLPCEDIRTPTTWTTAGSPYVTNCRIRIVEGATLTVEPGVEVGFGEQGSLSVENGTLIVAGTPSQMVTFTSSKDVKGPGDWYGVSVGERGRADLHDLTIAYAGKSQPALLLSSITNTLTNTLTNAVIESSARGGIKIDEVNAALTDVTVRKSGGPGITISDKTDAPIRVTLTRVTILETGEAVLTEPNVQFDLHNITARQNGFNGIVTQGTATFPMIWRGGELPYICRSAVGMQAGLTIEPNTVVKFLSGATLNVKQGARLQALGEPAGKIFFTSAADDSACTSTTVDCDATNDGPVSPLPGSWLRLAVERNASAEIAHAEFRYGSDSMLSLSGPATITSTAFRQSSGIGVAVSNVDVSIADSEFTGNVRNALAIQATSPITVALRNSEFRDNGNSTAGKFAIVSMPPDVNLVNEGNQAPGFSNGLNGYLVTAGNMTQPHVWRAGDLPYIVNGTIDLRERTAQLTLEPGLTVKMGRASLQVSKGELRAGTADGDRVLVTALADDACSADQDSGCDTNADGASSRPGPGDWDTVAIGEGAMGALLRRTVLRYGGTSSTASTMLDLTHPGSTIASCELAYSSGIALRINLVNTSVVGNEIHHNRSHGVQIKAGTAPQRVVFRDNNIHDNGGAAIDTDANSEVAFEGNNVAQMNALNGIAIHGDVRAPTTLWRATSLPYLLTRTVDVKNGVLTIEPGAVIKFGDDVDLQTSFGRLVADGTSDRKIVFTSLKDDSDGVDSNPLEGDVNPAPGDWGSILFSSGGAGGSLSNVEIRYAGKGEREAVLINHSAATLHDALIRDCRGYGILVRDVNARIENTTVRNMLLKDGIRLEARNRPIDEVVLTNNVISGCRAGAAISADANVQLRLTANRATDNLVNGVLVEGTMTVSREWPAGDLIFVVGRRLSVGRGAKLTLQPGLVVKASADAALEVDSGEFSAVGTADQEIVLTSVRDDSQVDGNGNGDTNPIEGEVKPAPGNWAGLKFGSGARGVTIRHVRVLYAGASTAALQVEHPNVLIDASEVAHTVGSCIWMNGGGGTLRANFIHHCGSAGVRIEQTLRGPIELEGNVFTANERSVYHHATGTVHTANNVAIGNRYDAMDYCSNVRTNQTWYSDLARELTCSVNVMAGAELTVEPGTVLLVRKGQNLTVNHQLRGEGIVVALAEIEGTSEDDFWSGLIFAESGGGYLRSSLLVRGGTSGQPMLSVRSASPVQILNNLLIRANSTGMLISGTGVSPEVRGNLLRRVEGSSPIGLRVSSNAQPQLRNNRIAATNTALRIDDTTPAMVAAFNSFAESYEFAAVNNDRAVCVDAQYNWWGDRTGPYDPANDRDDPCNSVVGQLENTRGKGHRVSKGVNYKNYLDTAMPAIPVLDGPRCGVTNARRQRFTGTTSPGATVNVYEGTDPTPIRGELASSDGRFDFELNLSPGIHRLSVDAGEEQMRSANVMFRVLDIQPDLLLDPASTYFEYGPAGSRRRQPVRDEAGCATGCVTDPAAKTSGRVLLPPDVPVKVRTRVSGTVTSAELILEDRPPMALRSAPDGYWETEEFVPQQGSFALRLNGGALTCPGFIYLGGSGVVYMDTGVREPPVRSYDFESGNQGWVGMVPWAREQERVAGQPIQNWYFTDSPGFDASGQPLPYKPRLNITLSNSEPVDLSGVSAPTLRFRHRYLFGRGDSGYIEVQTPLSASWIEIAKFQGRSENATAGAWLNHAIPLDRFAGQSQVYIRFRLYSDSGQEDDGWYIDDVSVGSGGAFNNRYDLGEPVIEGAEVQLRQRNLDTGEWLWWNGNPTGQANPQETDRSGRYGFFNLPVGEYQATVSPPSGSPLGPQTSPVIVVWNGAFTYDIALVGGQPIYLPITARSFDIR